MSRGLRGAHVVLALAVLAQAVLAGSFLTGSGGARSAHLIVGSLLPFVALGTAIAAWVGEAKGRCDRRRALWATLVPVLLWIQNALGHMPMPITTVIHVPLGVAILGLPSRGPAVPGSRGGASR